MTIKYINQLDICNKRVLIRVDYNVPCDNNMNIIDDTRIKATLSTIRYCLKHNASIILISHLGRPRGEFVSKLSLRPISELLSKLLDQKIQFIDSPIDKNIKERLKKLNPKDIVLLENIRFNQYEEKNDNEFGKILASLADIYINDAFATAHRCHSSNNAITNHIPECAAGFLFKEEIDSFKKIFLKPKKPLVVLLGGAKISTKLNALENILEKINYIIIGGGMAFTFLKAKGYEIGKSIFENELVGYAKDFLKVAEKNKVKVILPIDIVIASDLNNKPQINIVPSNQIPPNMTGFDIGPKSIELFGEVIKNAKTVVWNGPMGVFEISPFEKGTNKIAQIIVEAKCLSMIGGGDSISAIKKIGIEEKISHISTGGGAFLELLKNKTLPAITALDKY